MVSDEAAPVDGLSDTTFFIPGNPSVRYSFRKRTRERNCRARSLGRVPAFVLRQVRNAKCRSSKSRARVEWATLIP
jgi:hypothetical protein